MEIYGECFVDGREEVMKKLLVSSSWSGNVARKESEKLHHDEFYGTYKKTHRIMSSS